MSKLRKPTSGTSNQLPKLLKYPNFLPFDKHTETIKGIYCYIIEYYGNAGLSVLISRNNGNTAIVFGDWSGNTADMKVSSKLQQLSMQFVHNHLQNLINVMQLANIKQAQYYFSTYDDLTLVDVQISQNKLLGPGMINDVFGKIFKTQKVIKVEAIDDRAIDYITMGSGSYAGDLIIKPSKFRTHGNTNSAFYLELRR